jgi:hypothetical protein
LPALSERPARAALSAGFVAVEAACEARLRAFCWRPRASPPFFAAARRLLAGAPCDLLDEELRERLADDLVDRLAELRDDADALRELDDPPDEPDFRAAPPPLLLEELLRV